VLAGALPQTPLGELTVLPRPHSWLKGRRFAAGGELRKGLGRGKGEWERQGKGEVGE